MTVLTVVTVVKVIPEVTEVTVMNKKIVIKKLLIKKKKQFMKEFFLIQTKIYEQKCHTFFLDKNIFNDIFLSWRIEMCEEQKIKKWSEQKNMVKKLFFFIRKTFVDKKKM